jgi:hypothetical protein
MHRRTGGAAVLACALAVTASACGGSSPKANGVASLGGGDGTGTTSSTPTSTQSTEDRMLAYAKCMRSHGVDMPDPTQDAHGNFKVTIRAGGPGKKGQKLTQGPDQKTVKAMQACQKLMPGGIQKLSPADKQRLQDAALQYARCMRKHGIDVPDPKIGDGGMVQIMGGPNTASPKAQKIAQQCQSAFRSARVGIGGDKGTSSGTGS